VRNILAILTGLVMSITSASTRGGVVDVSVRFEPADQTVGIGEPITVNLVADVTSPVIGWGLDVIEDTPGIITPSAPMTIGPAWWAADTVDGDGLAGLAFPDSYSGTGILLATFSFTAIAEGDTYLLASYTLGDDTEGFALDPSGFANVEFVPGHITVTPEPAALAMLMIGGLIVSRRRYRPSTSC
jgi:hypothetical protein